MVAYRYRLLALVQKQGQKLFTTEGAEFYFDNSADGAAVHIQLSQTTTCQ